MRPIVRQDNMSKDIDTPTVSVMIPTLNEEEVIYDALESISKQTFKDIEILVCDGKSVDNTRKKVKEFPDDRVRLIVEDPGLVNQQNRLVSSAKGKYLAQLDADAVASPDRLERQVEVMEANPQIVALGTGLRTYKSDGSVWRELEPPVGEEIKWQLLWTNAIYHTTAMFRRGAVQQIEGYRDGTVRDWDLIVRLGEVGELHNIQSYLTETTLRDSKSSGDWTNYQHVKYNTKVGVEALKRLEWKLTEYPREFFIRLKSSISQALNIIIR